MILNEPPNRRECQKKNLKRLFVSSHGLNTARRSRNQTSNPKSEFRNPKQIQTTNDQNDHQRKEFVRRNDYHEVVKHHSPGSRSAAWVRAPPTIAFTPKALHNIRCNPFRGNAVFISRHPGCAAARPPWALLLNAFGVRAEPEKFAQDNKLFIVCSTDETRIRR